MTAHPETIDVPQSRHLRDLMTPGLVLDAGKMHRNVARIHTHLAPHGVSLRPHVKTHKSTRIARELFGQGPRGAICVSTLSEARHFFEAGFGDMMYAVGIAPAKLEEVAALRLLGADLSIILDSESSARMAADFADQTGQKLDVWIELDVDGHRSGAAPEGDELIAIAGRLAASAHITLSGVMTHAGQSYQCPDIAAIRALAEQERARSVAAAQRLRAAGIACPRVSIGSTPTVMLGDNFDGVSEVRAGVFVFQDLFQAGLGVCAIDDIAVSVITTVIGHQRDKNWVITDAGWMALSRDRGTSAQRVDQGYGLVCDEDGHPIDDLIVASANQEHGIVAQRNGGPLDHEAMPIGTRLRILPNHACATAAQHDGYWVVDDGTVVDRWHRVRGW